MSFWRIPAPFGATSRPTLVQRHRFDVPASVEPTPSGMHDPLQPIAPELWHDYWTGDAPPAADAAPTGSVATATFVARERAALVVRVQCEGEPHTDYLVDLDALAEQVAAAHLARAGHGTLQRAQLMAGEVRRYAARLAAQDAGAPRDPSPPHEA